MMKHLLCLLFFIPLFVSCNQSESKKSNETMLYRKKEGKSALQTYPEGDPISDTAIRDFLSAHKNFRKYETLLLDFYNKRNYKYVWLNQYGLSPRIDMFVNLTQNAAEGKILQTEVADGYYH